MSLAKKTIYGLFILSLLGCTTACASETIQVDSTVLGKTETLFDLAELLCREPERTNSACVEDYDDGDDAPGRVYRIGSINPPPNEFSMRGEFEHQSAIMLSGGLCRVAPNVLRRIAKEAQGAVPLVILVNDADERNLATHELAETNCQHRFLVVRHDTVWARDYGPTILTDRTASMIIDAPYENERPNDDNVPVQLSRISQTETQHTTLRLPGGNLLSNGRQLCITTTRVQQENPGLTQRKIAGAIAAHYGAETIGILDPLLGEATGHVDMFATFTSPRTVVVGKFDPKLEPENAAILDRNAAMLASIRVGDKKLRVFRIPMPPRVDEQVLTFTNVIFANGKLLVPIYPSTGLSLRTEVRKLYARLLPNWDICFVPADNLICDGGALHCVASNLNTLSVTMNNTLTPSSEVAQYQAPFPFSLLATPFAEYMLARNGSPTVQHARASRAADWHQVLD